MVRPDHGEAASSAFQALSRGFVLGKCFLTLFQTCVLYIYINIDDLSESELLAVIIDNFVIYRTVDIQKPASLNGTAGSVIMPFSFLSRE